MTRGAGAGHPISLDERQAWRQEQKAAAKYRPHVAERVAERRKERRRERKKAAR